MYLYQIILKRPKQLCLVIKSLQNVASRRVPEGEYIFSDLLNENFVLFVFSCVEKKILLGVSNTCFLAHLSQSDKVSFCDRAVSVVRPCVRKLFACDHSRGHIFHGIFMKIGQNVHLDDI